MEECVCLTQKCMNFISTPMGGKAIEEVPGIGKVYGCRLRKAGLCKVSLYGRRLSSIPCFRQTYLTGIGSGLAAGIACFMFTSRPRTASHVAFGTFFATTLGYWFYCRYTFARASFHHRQLKHAMKQHILTEGTADDVTGDRGAAGESMPPARPELADA